MGSVCLWGAGGTHCACLLTAGLLHVVTCNQDPQFLSGGRNLQKPTLYPHLELQQELQQVWHQPKQSPSGPVGPSAFYVPSMGNSEVHNVEPPNSPRTGSDHSPASVSVSASRHAGPALCPRLTLQQCAAAKVPEAEEYRLPGAVPGLNTVQPGSAGPLD